MLELLYTEIGRGHPYYLDGIVDALIRSARVRLVRRQTNVFDLSHGLSRLAWKTARWLYRHSSPRNPIGLFYARLRKKANYNHGNWGLHFLARDIRSQFMAEESPLLVAHPVLVAALRGRRNLIYQHGEMSAPHESLVLGAERLIVPTKAVAQAFLEAGYDRERIHVSGLCIEPALVRQATESFELRRKRLEGRGVLTGAFYSSGAEPKVHVERLIEVAWSTVTAGHRVLVFARTGGLLAAQTIQRFGRIGADFLVVTPETPIEGEIPRATLLLYQNRREEYALTARLFSWFDFVVAPAHERSNWGMGLGLPMVIIGPDIGSFAPLNRRLLLDRGVALEVGTRLKAESLGEKLRRLHKSSVLAAMAEAGWQRHDINGFSSIAEWLDQHYS
ncbi:MAG TPA: hypothetical protein PLF13_07270 [candidate division Zixibacteria bacterium]|nr:hypothetical protein [candidate division Zixibacteria bacterium]